MYQENTTENHKRLYRSRHDRMISGVCGGFADYLNMEPLLIRLAWVLLTLFGGVGLILYIAAVIIMPENPGDEQEVGNKRSQSNNKALFWGALFVLVGIALIFKQMGLFYYFNVWQIPWQFIWAVFFILIGVFLLYNRNPFHKEEEQKMEAEMPGAEAYDGKRIQIYRSRENRMLAGVCAGLAEYFNLDVTVVRLAYVLITLASIGVGIVAYIVMILVFPEKSISAANGE